MRKLFMMFFVAAAMMTSCSSDEELSSIVDNANGKVTVTVEPFTYADDDTRASLSISSTGKNIDVLWDKYDTIGIFPVSPSNSQIRQTFSSSDVDDNNNVIFSPKGWTFVPDGKYAAYYPYQNLNTDTRCDQIPIDMRGQTQDGNDNYAHISKHYNYMWCGTAYPQDGMLGFHFNHAIAIVKLNLTMPVAATWNSVTLKGKNDWIVKGTMNANGGSISNTTTASSVTLSLKNVSTTESSKQVTLYLAVIPQSMPDIKLNAVTSDRRSYTVTIGKKNFSKGIVYSITKDVPAKGTQNGHEYVSLGLPSGLKWATMNVGANSPVECGNYYAWGETATAQFNYYGWDLYRLCNKSMNALTKYCTKSEYGRVDYKTTLYKENDVASAMWGAKWRMPTKGELDELINNCYWEWTLAYNNEYGKTGYIVYAVKSPEDKGKIVTDDGPKEKGAPLNTYSCVDSHIFIPIGGYMSESELKKDGSLYLWSSTLDKDRCFSAYSMRICGHDGFRYKTQASHRCLGMNVRAVCE